MNDTLIQAVLSAVDNMTPTLEKIDESLENLSKTSSNTSKEISQNNTQTESSSHRLTGGFMQMASAMGAVALAAKAFSVVKDAIGGAVNRFDTLQKYPTVMKALGYSAQDVGKSTQILNKGIKGLPTSLDSITSIAQQLGPLTGSATKASKSAIALNNAFLSSGASVADTSRGLQQYTQMLSTGKVDLMSYRTLMETMPIALRKVANSFGYTGKSAEQDLYSALQSGKVTVDELNDRFIKLNDGVGGFADLAKKNSNGIATSFTNAKTAIVRGIADAIEAINTGLTDNGLPSIQQMIESAGDSISNVFAKIAKAIPPVIAAIAPFVKALKPIAPLLKIIVAAFVGLGVIAMFSSKIAPMITVFGALRNVLGKVGGIAKSAGSSLGNLLKKLFGIGGSGKHAATGLDETSNSTKKVGKASSMSAGQTLAMGAAIMMAAFGAATLVASFALLVNQVTKLAKVGPMGAMTFLAVAAGMAAVIAVMGVVGKMIGSLGPKAAIAYAGMALLVASFALLTMAVTAFASTGTQGIVALTALTVAIVAITAVMGMFAPVFQASAVGLIAFGAAVLMVSAGITLMLVGLALVAVAFTGLVNAITGLASQGPIAVAVIAALTVGIAAIVVVLAIFGPLLTVSAVGLLAFGAALLMAGVGIGIAAAGIAQLVDAFANLMSTNTVLGQIISDVWNGIKEVIGAVIDFVKPLATNAFNTIKSVGSTAMNGLKAVISTVWNAIKKFFKTGVSFIKSIIHVDLRSNGRQIMNSFFEGLKSVWNSIKSFVSGIAGWIKSHKGPISYDRRLLIPAGQAIMGGLNNGLIEGFKAVQSNVSSMADAIGSSMSVTLPPIQDNSFNRSLNAIQGRMQNMSANVTGTLTANAAGNNDFSERLWRDRMAGLMTNAVNKLDNVDQHPEISFNTARRINDFNNRLNADAYSMWKGR